MIVFNKFTPMIVMVLVLLLPSLSFGGNSGSQTLSRVYVDQEGVVQIWGEPDNAWDYYACDSNDRIVFQPEHNGIRNENYSEGYALIVASFLQGNKIDGWVDGCVYPLGNVQSYPILWGVSSR